MAWVSAIPAIWSVAMAQALASMAAWRAMRPVRRQKAWLDLVRDYPQIVKLANHFGGAISTPDKPVRDQDAVRAWTRSVIGDLESPRVTSSSMSRLGKKHFTRAEAAAIRRAVW